MEPRKLEVSESDHIISIVWSDGHDSKYSAFHLRSECPCAMCKGEPGVFGRYYEMAEPVVDQKIEPLEIESVGRYGLKISWSDKHDLGIYSFDYLRSLCECEDCQKSRKPKEQKQSDAEITG
jgi:DUF971 family protein